MTDITLISGTNRDLEVTLVGNQTVPEPIDLTLVDHIVWEVFAIRGTVPLLKKNLDDGITVTDATNGEILIVIDPEDTPPEANGLGFILGSTTLDMVYKHESRLTFVDNTQEVPGSFRGKFTVEMTGTYGET